MKLKAGVLLQAQLVLAAAVRDGRSFGAKGKYRVARMATLLGPEAEVVEAQRVALIKKHGVEGFAPQAAGAAPDAPKVSTGWSVTADRLPAFLGEWSKVAEDEIELSAGITPIPLSSLDPVEPRHSMTLDQRPEEFGFSIQEFAQLGELVTDDC